MDKKKSNHEKTNGVVEAMLRAREKEMQQDSLREDTSVLTSEEYAEMYQKIITRLKDEGLIENADAGSDGSEDDSESGDDEDPDPEAESGNSARKRTNPRIIRDERLATKTKRRWFQSKVVKAASVCVIAGVAVFGLSMTSEANRLWMMQTVNQALGTGDLMNVNNDEDRALSAGSEDEAKKAITDALHAEVPDFYYLPEGMTYQGYELGEEVGYARMDYSCKDGFLYLGVSNSNSDMSQGKIEENCGETDSLDIDTLSGKMHVQIKQVDVNEAEQYTATWNYKNSYYTLFGEISKDELIKILENLSYDM